MVETGTFLLMVAVALPAAVGAVLRLVPHRRVIAACSVAGSFLLLALAIVQKQAAAGWLVLDGFSAAPAFVFTALVLIALLCAPRRDLQWSGAFSILLCLSGTLLAYTSANLLGTFVGWTLSTVPLFTGGNIEPPSRWFAKPRVLSIASIALFASALLIVGTAYGTGALIAPLSRLSETHLLGVTRLAFALLMAAALIRNGIFPFHGWMISGIEGPRTILFGLLAGSQVGALVIARIVIPLFPSAAQESMAMVSSLALASVIYSAFLASGESRHKRVLGLVVVSQSGFIISGLESRNVEGITGALLHWFVVAAATSGLLLVYRALEARCPATLGQSYAGLASKAPRLAVLFGISGLALIGLPGTLGFCAEDLLFHGALESHPLLGLALPVATALIAVRLYRLFASIFLGRPSKFVPDIPDALPRERWALTSLALFLIVAGLAPQWLVATRSAAASHIAAVLSDSGHDSR